MYWQCIGHVILHQKKSGYKIACFYVDSVKLIIITSLYKSKSRRTLHAMTKKIPQSSNDIQYKALSIQRAENHFFKQKNKQKIRVKLIFPL